MILSWIFGLLLISIIGVFNTVMIKPAFYFPPHTISIDNGEFIFNEVSLPALSISNDLQPLRTNIFQEVYPNPFNSSIVIELFMEEGPRDISLSIFDINGRNLETLFSGSAATMRRFSLLPIIEYLNARGFPNFFL